MHRFITRAIAPVGVALLASLAACGDSTKPASGPLTVLLTDAPFPYDSVARVDVHVVRIDAKQAETTDADAQDQSTIGSENDTPGASDNGWTTIATPNETVNLLDLQSGATTNLGTLTIPTGTYRSFRLILDTQQSSVTLKNGMVLSGSSTPGIKFPSAGRTGIKVVLAQPISLTANGSVMVLDFDLAQSFVMRGNTISQNGLLFKPVIRATARDITGAIRGTVIGGTSTGPAIADATVEVLKAGTALDDTVSANVITSTKTDANGGYLAAFLLPGSYSLRATAPSGSAYTKALLAGPVTVTSGDTTTATTIVVP